jgi:hypothetical protein
MMNLLHLNKYTLLLLWVTLPGCYSTTIPQVEYSPQAAELIKFSECKWIRLNLVCTVKNLTDGNIPQRHFSISAHDASGEVVFEELIKTPIDANSTVEKWFESFKSRERVKKLVIDIHTRRFG